MTPRATNQQTEIKTKSAFPLSRFQGHRTASQNINGGAADRQKDGLSEDIRGFFKKFLKTRIKPYVYRHADRVTHPAF